MLANLALILSSSAYFSSTKKFFDMKKWLLFVPVLLPFIAAAHNGHGFFDASNIMHYLTSPEHALPLGGGIVLMGLVLRSRNKKTA
jgi:hypothetical protein